MFFVSLKKLVHFFRWKVVYRSTTSKQQDITNSLLFLPAPWPPRVKGYLRTWEPPSDLSALGSTTIETSAQSGFFHLQFSKTKVFSVGDNTWISHTNQSITPLSQQKGLFFWPISSFCLQEQVHCNGCCSKRRLREVWMTQWRKGSSSRRGRRPRTDDTQTSGCIWSSSTL